jgi:acid stress-induced BolA-like protein IbaG/YrbA
MDAQQVADLIRRSIPDARVDVQSEDNTHFAALLVGAAFEGRREIHAFSIEAYTPQEWAARGAGTPGGG